MISQTPLTILLVDDSTADRTLYRHFLSSTGTYSFLEAATGEEGLRLCQTAQPDCLILDFYLPDMDGFGFLDTLQAETVSLPYPVVILTGQGTEQLAVQAMHRGVQDYIVKDDLAAYTLRRVIVNAVDKFRLQQMLKTHQSLLPGTELRPPPTRRRTPNPQCYTRPAGGRAHCPVGVASSHHRRGERGD